MRGADEALDDDLLQILMGAAVNRIREILGDPADVTVAQLFADALAELALDAMKGDTTGIVVERHGTAQRLVVEITVTPV